MHFEVEWEGLFGLGVGLLSFEEWVRVKEPMEAGGRVWAGGAQGPAEAGARPPGVGPRAWALLVDFSLLR